SSCLSDCPKGYSGRLSTGPSHARYQVASNDVPRRFNHDPHAWQIRTNHSSIVSRLRPAWKPCLANLFGARKSMFELGFRLSLLGPLGGSLLLLLVASCATGTSPASTFGRDATS